MRAPPPPPPPLKLSFEPRPGVKRRSQALTDQPGNWPGPRQVHCSPRSATGTLTSTGGGRNYITQRAMRRRTAGGANERSGKGRCWAAAGVRAGLPGPPRGGHFGLSGPFTGSPLRAPERRFVMEAAPDGSSPLRGGEAEAWRVVTVGDPGLPAPQTPLRPQSPMAAASLRFPAEVRARPPGAGACQVPRPRHQPGRSARRSGR